MRSRVYGQSPIQTMIWFMVIVTVVVGVGLGGYVYWTKKKQSEEATRIAQENAAEAQKAAEGTFEHKPTEEFDVFGFKVPPLYRFTQKAEITPNGGVAFLVHDESGVTFRLEKKAQAKRGDLQGALDVYIPEELSEERIELLEGIYNMPPREYAGLDELYLSDGTPYRLVAFYETTQSDPEKPPVRWLKAYTELIYPDGSMLELMAFKLAPQGEGDPDAEITALGEGLQRFLVETGADRDSVIEMPELPEGQASEPEAQ